MPSFGLAMYEEPPPPVDDHPVINPCRTIRSTHISMSVYHVSGHIITSPYADLANSEVQWPHRRALMGIVMWQNWHSFVVGSAGGATFSSRFI